MLADVTAAERTKLLELPGKVLAGTACTADHPPIPLAGRRNRPAPVPARRPATEEAAMTATGITMFEDAADTIAAFAGRPV